MIQSEILRSGFVELTNLFDVQAIEKIAQWHYDPSIVKPKIMLNAPWFGYVMTHLQEFFDGMFENHIIQQLEIITSDEVVSNFIEKAPTSLDFYIPLKKLNSVITLPSNRTDMFEFSVGNCIVFHNTTTRKIDGLFIKFVLINKGAQNS